MKQKFHLYCFFTLSFYLLPFFLPIPSSNRLTPIRFLMVIKNEKNFFLTGDVTICHGGQV